MADVDNTIALTSLADIREYLQIVSNNTSETSILGFLINECSRLINDYTGRWLYTKAWVEYHDGIGGNEIITAQYPIISVTSVYDDIDRAFGSSSLISSSDYYVEKQSGIIRLNYDTDAFKKGRANIKVSYTAGYATIPQSIQNAVKLLIAFKYKRLKSGRFEVQSESIGDKQTVFVDREIPNEVKLLLAPHIKSTDSPTYAYND